MTAGFSNITLGSVTGGPDFVVNGGNGTATQTLNFTATAGTLGGAVTFANNFDNVAAPVLPVSGAAYDYANPAAEHGRPGRFRQCPPGSDQRHG